MLNFWNYILAVSAGECRGKEFDGEARKAINMAIKTYTWHFCSYLRAILWDMILQQKCRLTHQVIFLKNKKVTEDMEAVHNVDGKL